MYTEQAIKDKPRQARFCRFKRICFAIFRDASRMVREAIWSGRTAQCHGLARQQAIIVSCLPDQMNFVAEPYDRVAASSLFGAPMFTLQSSASSKDFEIRSIRVAGKPDLDGDEHVQEIVDLTRLKENVESPRRRHQASSSKDNLVIPRNFMNLTPNPIGSSTYSASEYSRWSSNPSGKHVEMQPPSPSSPKAALRDMQKARSTPSPKHSPRLVSFKPEVGQHTSIASGMATIKPLRVQERSHGLSIYDLYARDCETRAAQPAKPYGWI